MNERDGLDKEAAYETATVDVPKSKERMIGILETGSEQEWHTKT